MRLQYYRPRPGTYHKPHSWPCPNPVQNIAKASDADSRNRLGARGYVIYLYTSVKQQLERTQRGRSRPMLESGDPEAVLEELMKSRDPLYREIADLIVDTDGRRVHTVAREIHESI